MLVDGSHFKVPINGLVKGEAFPRLFHGFRIREADAITLEIKLFELFNGLGRRHALFIPFINRGMSMGGRKDLKKMGFFRRRSDPFSFHDFPWIGKALPFISLFGEWSGERLFKIPEMWDNQVL